MKTWVRKSLKVGVLSAGLLLVAGNAANAADDWNTGGNVGLLDGNQVKITAQVPINVCGNAVGALLGAAQAQCVGGSAALLSEHALEDDWTSFGNVGLVDGNQIKALVQAPINVSGNAVGALLGAAQARSAGGSVAGIAGRGESGYAPRVAEADWTTGGNVGIGNGNQVYVPIQIPINVCGNAIAVVGAAQAACVGGAAAVHHEEASDVWNTGLNVGLVNGNQAKVVAQVPINVCGNAIAVIGAAQAQCAGGAAAVIDNSSDRRHHHDGRDNRHHDGRDNRNHGDWDHNARHHESQPVEGSRHERSGDRWNTGGNVGLIDGNQIKALVQVPVDVSGNAVGALLGAAQASSLGGALAGM